MKKFISSAFLVVVFSMYVLSKQVLGSNPVIVPPAQPASSSSSADVSSSSSDTSSSPPDAGSSRAQPVETPAPVPQPVPATPTPAASSSQASSATPPPAPPPPPASSSSSSAAPQGMYRNGTYTSGSVDAYYGNVQIQVSVQNGRVSNVQFLDYPQDRGHSVEINTYATPILQSEAIQRQSAPVDIVSGATATSDAFNQALTSVLAQIRN